MRYPKMSTQRNVTVSVPQLNGGVNLCDMQHAIADNQLSDCLNMWWKDGALRTRPALCVKETLEHDFTKTQPLNDGEALLMYVGLGYQSEGSGTVFYAAHVTAAGEVTPIGSATDAYSCGDKSCSNALGLRAPKGSGYEWIFFLDGQNHVVGWSKDNGWGEVKEYAPLVMMNCTGTTDDGNVYSNATGTTLEAFNLISNKFRVSFMTDGKSEYFVIPASLCVEDIVALSLDIGGTATNTVDVNGERGPFEINASAADFGLSTNEYTGVKIYVTYMYGVENKGVNGREKYHGLAFSCKASKKGGGEETVYLPYSEYNNLTITATRAKCDRDVIQRMKTCAWFGGDVGGLGGGIHLFLAGNPDKPNLVHWSDVNNPLYFPENNYVYVGEESNTVTALSKQSELLVILCEHGVYCAQYVSGDVPTIDEMESGAAIETTVHKSYFTITQLHPSIGCRCPKSVRLVNNRLVWLDVDGHVYTLTGANRYSERNVRPLSPLIEKAISKHGVGEMKSAFSGEYDGYYLLLVGGNVYLMDTQTAAFNSINHYSREETAQKMLPWYMWSLPIGENDGKTAPYDTLVADGTAVAIVSNGSVYTLSDDGDEAIESSFTTKQYELGQTNKLKTVGQMYIRLGVRAGGEAEVTYITNAYNVTDPYKLTSSVSVDERDPSFMKTYRLTPNVHRVESFGVRVSCRDRIAVEGVEICYKNEGVIR